MIDSLADRLGSYDEAYRSLGVKPPKYSPPEPDVEPGGIDVSRGAYVNLSDRPAAVGNIMKTHNQLSKTIGARTIRERFGNPLDIRYRDADEVVDNMGAKAARMAHKNEVDYDVLNATERMLGMGFSRDVVEAQKTALKRQVYEQFGPGKAKAPDRAREIRKITRTDRIVNHRNNKPKKAA